MKFLKSWLPIIVIAAVSLGIAFCAPIEKAFRGYATLPAVGALFMALYQHLMSIYAADRQTQLQNEQQLFNLGATSHMANIAFDKHVEFCELYLAEVHELASKLFMDGPTRKASEHAGNLYGLRKKYTAWITSEMECKLAPFEEAVRKIATNAGYVDSTIGQMDYDEQQLRSVVIQEMHELHAAILRNDESGAVEGDVSVSMIVDSIRDILKISDLVKIREFLVNKASLAASKS